MSRSRLSSSGVRAQPVRPRTFTQRRRPVRRNSSGANSSRRIVVAVAAALIPLIAGCEAGFNAPILHWHQPTDGTTTTVGNITITDAFVLGAPIGSTLRIGQNAGLFFGLANV